MLPVKMTESIKIFARFKPCNNGKKKVHLASDGSTVRSVDMKAPIRVSFDRIFSKEETNHSIYSEVIRPMVESCLREFNNTVFA